MSRLGAVLLAAGASTRFGADNKLLADIAGISVIRRTAQGLLDAGLAEIVAVTGADAAKIERALAGLPLSIVHNANWKRGMGSSIGAGVRALSPALDGAFIVPGDLPLLPPALLCRQREAFDAATPDTIVFPVNRDGAQRNPVLWPKADFGRLAALDSAQGGKDLLHASFRRCKALPLLPGEDVSDIDTPDALIALRKRVAAASRDPAC